MSSQSLTDFLVNFLQNEFQGTQSPLSDQSEKDFNERRQREAQTSNGSNSSVSDLNTLLTMLENVTKTSAASDKGNTSINHSTLQQPANIHVNNGSNTMNYVDFMTTLLKGITANSNETPASSEDKQNNSTRKSKPVYEKQSIPPNNEEKIRPIISQNFNVSHSPTRARYIQYNKVKQFKRTQKIFTILNILQELIDEEDFKVDISDAHAYKKVYNSILKLLEKSTFNNEKPIITHKVLPDWYNVKPSPSSESETKSSIVSEQLTPQTTKENNVPESSTSKDTTSSLKPMLSVRIVHADNNDDTASDSDENIHAL